MNRNLKSISLIFALTFLTVSSGYAVHPYYNNSGKTGKIGKTRNVTAGCRAPLSSADLDINNVRARLLNGGDMWWDLDNARYEIPKIDPSSGEISKSSIFAGSLWFGGIDAGGQLKVAALAYRAAFYGGEDFWSGPLDDNASIDEGECAFWDYHFKITRSEVDSFITSGNPTNIITNWPAYGNTITIKNTTKTLIGNQYRYLAPYEDLDGDPYYNPENGEYPKFDVNKVYNCKTEDILYGDQTIWWVFNDKGNIHGNSEGAPIGLQVNSQAFAFATSDEINNMTFYDYTIYNRSTVDIEKFYMGQFVDTDLGNYEDDYVGCDVQRGLGFCYNADPDDDGILGYGANPPAVGLDFFRGPLADANDGIDNDGDGTIDEEGEEIIMSSFIYFSRVGPDWGTDPDISTDFYGYMSGSWKDGNPLTCGGNGYGGTVPVNYMFPWDTDPDNCPDWSEHGSSNPQGDRRFVQAAGPFTLKSGAVNKITIGVVWARASSGGELASVALMKTADDKAQALFDNCFRILDGPDAPSLGGIELDQEIILTISNSEGSNNNGETYNERDPTIDVFAYPNDTSYIFQGYQVFEVKDATVTTDELDEVTRARIIAQFDIKDNVSNLVNYEYDDLIGADVPKLMVTAGNSGIEHSVRVTKTLFSTGEDALVNFKKYYFMVVAYATNNYKEFDPTDATDAGQRTPYLVGRKAAGGGKVPVITVIPHKAKPQFGGSGLNAAYGDGPEITQVRGYGNGGNELELTQSSIDIIRVANSIAQPVYQGGKSPISVKVVDPGNVPQGNFKVVINGYVETDGTYNDSLTRWYIVNLTDKDTVYSDTTIYKKSEQLIMDVFANKGSRMKKVNWGLAVSLEQVTEPGVERNETNGLISSSITYEDESKAWLSGIADEDGQLEFENWIRAGNSMVEGWLDHNILATDSAAVNAIDPLQAYNGILGATWAPYKLCSDEEVTVQADPNNQMVNAETWNHEPPAWDYTKYPTTSQNENIRDYYRGVDMKDLANIDIVFTSNKDDWTRCVVMELGEEENLNEGNGLKFHPREHASWNKKYDGNGNPTYESGSTGLSWFPGYAIDVDKGIRLNIVFGESSWDISQNGNDMLWNPTSEIESPIGQKFAGGRHWVYILDTKYDESESSVIVNIKDKLSQTDEGARADFFQKFMWVGMTTLTEGEELLSTDAIVKIRVNNSYQSSEDITGAADYSVYNFSTMGIATSKNNTDSAKAALDLIGIVPNPYYAFSAYETSQVDNRVKFINLPDKVVISIYTVNGTLIRKYEKDDDTVTYLDWDLKNNARVPVSSGIYIIHFDVPDVGEKIMKWFGIMRPIDLDTF
ncbi:hypothetical protein JYU23_00900 [bacterium AH-315-C07]|nr:hypothetical protein [bacterium AH-315-C07]